MIIFACGTGKSKKRWWPQHSGHPGKKLFSVNNRLCPTLRAGPLRPFQRALPFVWWSNLSSQRKSNKKGSKAAGPNQKEAVLLTGSNATWHVSDASLMEARHQAMAKWHLWSHGCHWTLRPSLSIHFHWLINFPVRETLPICVLLKQVKR